MSRSLGSTSMLTLHFWVHLALGLVSPRKEGYSGTA
jgi:hypothetical protein